MFIKLALVVYFILPTTFVFAQTCPAKTKLPANLQPEVLGNYIRLNGLDSVEDLTCCIAKIPDIEIAVAINSIAAQDGDYLNPRVLIVKRNKAKAGSNSPTNLPPIEEIFSINSGAAHLRQGHSVEMMFVEPGSKSLVYTDIDFNKKNPMSHRNPKTCLLCHGHAGKNPPLGGPRPIFEVSPWPRFLIPLSKSNRDIFGPNFCKGRESIDLDLTKAANEALSSNPQYKCVKNLPRIPIGELDSGLNDLNDHRTARILLNTKNFQKFKYAFAGTNCPKFNPNDFIPEKVLATMTVQTNLPIKLQQLTSITEMVKFHDQEKARLQQESHLRDEKKAFFKNLVADKKPINLGDELVDSHNCISDIAAPEKLQNNSQNPTFFTGTNTVLHRYQVHKKIYQFGNAGLSAEVRFLFESRGIDLSDFMMSATSGSYNREIMANRALRQVEPPNSPLIKAIEQKDPTVRCAILKKLSFEAFGIKSNQENSVEDEQDILQ